MAGNAPKRALPSWMSTRDDAKDDKPSADDDREGAQKKLRRQGRGEKDKGEGSGGKNKSSSAGSSSVDFSKLLVECD